MSAAGDAFVESLHPAGLHKIIVLADTNDLLTIIVS